MFVPTTGQLRDHATYHRGQLNSMAKRAGGTPRPIMRYTWVLRGMQRAEYTSQDDG